MIIAAVFLVVAGIWLIRLSRKPIQRPMPHVIVIPVQIGVVLPAPEPTPEQIDFAAWQEELTP